MDETRMRFPSGIPPEMRVILSTLLAADDTTVTKIIEQVLLARPELSPNVVAFAVPDLTYAPARAMLERRSTGVVKSFFPDKGFGFIECPELKAAFGNDVYVHQKQVSQGLLPGTPVSFAVALNKCNKPQAVDVQIIGNPQSEPYREADDGYASAGGMGLCSGNSSFDAASFLSGVDGPGLGLGKGLAFAASGNGLYGGPLDYNGGGGGAARGGAGCGASRYDQGAEMWNPAVVGKENSKGMAKGQGKGGSVRQPRPDEQQTLGQFLGNIKSFNVQKGFGFIDCPELRGQFPNDVYLHNAQIGNFVVGDTVCFTAYLNRKGQPQAKDLMGPSGARGAGGGRF